MNESLTRVLFQKLVTMTGAEYEQGELIINQGRVVEVRSGVDASFAGITHDWSNCLILPGFVNAHCHLSLSGLQGRVTPQEKFVDWIESVVRENAALAWSHRVEALHQCAQTMLESGVTSLGDYFSHPELLVEYQRLPFRQVLFLETLGFQSSLAREKTRSVETLLQEHPSVKDYPVQLGIAPHAPYSVSPALFKEMKKLADRQGCRFSCHVAEAAEEIRFLQKGEGDFLELLHKRKVYDSTWEPPGVSPVQYLEQLGVLRNMTAIHLNYLVEGDLERLLANNVSAVFCPGSTQWFGRKTWMPVRALLEWGIPVGLGTDSWASNDSMSFLNEIRNTEKMVPELHRLEILWLATVGGSRALGFEKFGLTPGQPADMISFQFDHPEQNWWDLPFDPDRHQVNMSMVAGNIVYRNMDNLNESQ